MSFSLRGASIPTNGSGRVLITDINPNGDNNEDALICRSEIVINFGGNWFLHPTEMSTDDVDRIVNTATSDTAADRGWKRNRDIDSGHRLVRLRRTFDTAEEGVFTCHIPGDNNTPRYLYITYPGES